MPSPEPSHTATSPGAPSDEALMTRAATGDDDAFDALVRRHAGPLFNYFVRMVGHQADAEDLFQEAWLRAHRNRATYAVRARFTTWLYTIAGNLVRDEYRRRGRRRSLLSLTAAWREDDTPLEDTLPDPTPGARDQAQDDEAMRQVQAAVARLPHDRREAVVLSHFHGLGLAEIAQIQGCSVGTVKSRISRAREDLRAQLAHLDELVTGPKGRDGQHA